MTQVAQERLTQADSPLRRADQRQGDSIINPDLLPTQISTPKLSSKKKSRSYRYYAGFSEEFVREILTLAKPRSDEVLLDPWNGSGTTTRVAAQLGIRAIGLDLNPAMAVVAEGRLLDSDELHQVAKTLRETTRRMKTVHWSNDPLLTWFTNRSAA